MMIKRHLDYRKLGPKYPPPPMTNGLDGPHHHYYHRFKNTNSSINGSNNSNDNHSNNSHHHYRYGHHYSINNDYRHLSSSPPSKEISIPEEEKVVPVIKPVRNNKIGAGGIIVDSLGRLLIVKGREKWSLPKGHFEENEKYHICAMREIREETSLNIKINSGDRYIDVKGCVYYIIKLNTVGFDDISPNDKIEIHDIGWYKIDEIIENRLNMNKQLSYIINKWNYIQTTMKTSQLEYIHVGDVTFIPLYNSSSGDNNDGTNGTNNGNSRSQPQLPSPPSSQPQPTVEEEDAVGIYDANDDLANNR